MSVNGHRRELDLEPARTLADVLAADGVPVGCSDGTCGACTVLVGDDAVRSCMMLGVQCQDVAVRTAEALPGERCGPAAPDPDAARCGSCLPGLVVLAMGALENDPSIAGDSASTTTL